MSEANPAANVDVTRQVQQQLDAYRAAGVEWLPNTPPLAVVSAPPAAAPGPAGAASLFAAHDAILTPEADALSDEEPRRQELTVLRSTVAKCVRCAALASTRRQTVFGVGPLDPDLCFIGEAPGADEDRQGEPFVGAAGQLLNRIIAACGLKREEVYICNILKCRPPGNRQPQPDEAHNCREYLDRQLELVRPRFLCALGACAAQNLLGVSTGIKRLRGTFHDYRGIPVLCTFHPAYLLRNPEAKKDVWEDMKKLLARMGRSVPGTKRE
jgi:DNA polymerase